MRGPQLVSSKFIRQEASRSAADGEHARIIMDRFSILRTRILREMRNHGWRRLAVVPLTKGAGGTFVAINLALALSRQKQTEVILMDLDFGDPSVSAELGVPGCEPVTDAILQGHRLSDLVNIVEEAPNLSILVPGHAEPDAAELIQSEDFSKAMTDLRNHYPASIEIIDTAPLIGGDMALATLPLADAMLLVADGREGTAADMTLAQRLLKDMPPVMGVVLNKSED
ncbi:CpsD/CapB family tyrosine-protein kinase [Paracoccus sp. MBLB3053]|uniref:CpsD/CapB family tyrosine-protein kinase n=1 Tax=Paracoccus aurantius TaxID=3073814 RepID=A0ABU2HMS3_9RHOB|nr:CpsD/CapB family tyrosine-protein kinase [Paracoccus sp. MBLB3053]MDS9466342.1 CpsD/CapB family tyrosine-protein kinase [Paracoccus sp. MBLB3053]